MKLRSLFIGLLVICILFTLTTAMVNGGSVKRVLAQVQPPDKEGFQPELFETGEISLLPMGMDLTSSPPAPGLLSLADTSLINETEPNNTPATANPLVGAGARIRADVFPNADEDFFSFTGQVGDRVYAATMTSFSANGSTDSVLTLYGTNGITPIEVDDNDGSLGGSSSSIAGATLPATGTYYLQVKHFSATSQLRPYDLYFMLRRGTPVLETEPNDVSSGGQTVPASGWVQGVVNPAADQDVFTVSMNAGDTIFLSLDLDPERDGTTWNGRLGLGLFGSYILMVNDTSVTLPNSEAFFLTVKEAGVYSVYVDEPTGLGNPANTYHLSVYVIPTQPDAAACTTYTSSAVPQVIPDGPGLVTSTITVPGNPRIADMNVSLSLTHTNMPDLDVHLVSPAGNDNGLFTDVGSSTQTTMNLVLNDEAATPIGLYTVVQGMVHQPEASYRLSWYDHTDAGGDWTLKIYDDTALNGGSLQSWGITICEAQLPPACEVGYDPITVFSTDFEANNGGFTTSGTTVDWAWGAPSAAPIASCNSGTSCWKTNLSGTYSLSTIQNLLSPAVDLTGLTGPITLHWAQKYQMETATFDGAYVQVQQAGGANPTRLWTWMDATMTNTVGNPTATIPQSAGWSERWADISAYADQNAEVLFHLDSDTSVNLAGLAIDDVRVTACQKVTFFTYLPVLFKP